MWTLIQGSFALPTPGIGDMLGAPALHKRAHCIIFLWKKTSWECRKSPTQVFSPTFLPGYFGIAFHTFAWHKLFSIPGSTSPNDSAHFLWKMIHIAFYCSYKNQDKRLYITQCRQPSACICQNSSFEINNLHNLLAEYLSMFEIQVLICTGAV